MLCRLAVLTVLAALCSPAIADEIIVHARVLHVRDEPDADSDVTARLEAGDRAPILEVRQSWIRIGFHRGESHIIGWVAHDWITRFDPKSATPIGRNGRVSPPHLNVRQSPSTQSQALQVLVSGTEVLVLGVQKRWYKVRFGAETPPAVGWVHANYISFPPPNDETPADGAIEPPSDRSGND